jgi:hypothetical protein
MYQQLWVYKVEDKLYLGVREQKRWNTTGLEGYSLLHAVDAIHGLCSIPEIKPKM